METYRLSWVPSVSTFVDAQQVFCSIDSGELQQLQENLASNITYVDATFPTGASIRWFVRTVGDNGTTADSVHDEFVAVNQEVVQSATGLVHQWLSHQS